jgi:tRNA A-37 threonylcarbamoyl transferase component Bud32
MVPAMPSPTGSGHLVAGRYELLDQIGRGAMGTVWRARDLVLAREVAVKQVRLPTLMAGQERNVLRQRTLREARVSARLRHPGVITVFDVIEVDGTPWIVMELVAARSLDLILAEDGPLPPHRAAAAGVLLLQALASAHAAGIVHRDVKPANVLITPAGRVVLTDFGIAAVNGDPGLTQTGMVMGTPGFCAPERVRGEPASPASDLWSLGATLYAAVEGHGPFDGQGTPLAVMASIVHADPPPPRCGGPLGTVIAALLNRDPAQRPDAARAARLLSDAASQPAGTASQPAGPQPGADRVTRPASPGTDQLTTVMDPPVSPDAGPVPVPAGFAQASLSGTPARARWPAARRARRTARSRLLTYGVGGIAVILAGLTAGTVIGLVRGHPGAGTPPAVSSQHNAASAGGLPAGYRWFTRPGGSAAAGVAAAGFTVAVPAGWQVRQQPAATYLRDPVSAATISIVTAPPQAAGPVQEAWALERAALNRGSYPRYRRIAVTSFVFRGHLAASWRFSYWRRSVGTMDALEVVIQLPAHRGPATCLLLASAPAARWQATRAVLAEMLSTLRPAS